MSGTHVKHQPQREALLAACLCAPIAAFSMISLINIGFLWLRDNSAFEGNPWIIDIYELM